MNIHSIATTWPVLLAGALLVLTGSALRADDSGYGNGDIDGARQGPLAEARELIDMGSFGSAIWSLKRVLEDSPNNADAHNLLAFSYRNTGRFDLAEQHYDRALEIDPGHRGAYAYLGVLYLETGRADRARQNLDKLRDLCGRDCPEYNSLRSAIQRDHSGSG